MEKRLVYNGGSMTNFMGRDFQLKMNDIIEDVGLDVYTPSKNKEINDKQNVASKDIAKMIVAKDSEAIINSDIRLFNNLGTVGTSIEIGQVLGMNHFATIIKQLIEKREASINENDGLDNYKEMSRQLRGLLDEIWCLCASEIEKDFILFDVDVRTHDEPEIGYRRSKGYHQYERGVGIALMNNENGYMTLEDEVIPKLKELSLESFDNAFKVKFNEQNDLILEKGLLEMLDKNNKV